MRFKDRFLPCVTNPLVNTRPGRPFAQAARSLCDSLEQRRDLGTCLSFISLNAELVASRTSAPLGSRSHEKRRRLDGGLLRGVERRAAVGIWPAGATPRGDNNGALLWPVAVVPVIAVSAIHPGE